MPANAAYITTVEISDDDVTYVDLGGIRSLTAPLSADSLDTTHFNETQWRSFIQGLKGIDGSVDGDWIYNDAGQVILQAGFDDGTSVYLKVLFDGTHGYKVECRVFTFERSPAVDGLVPLVSSFKSVAAPTAI